MKGVETPASEIAYQTKTFGSNLPTALYFTASGVFSTSSVQKPLIPVKVLCENLKFVIQHNHFLVTKMFAKRKSAATSNFLELGSRVLRNLDSLFVYIVIFSKLEELQSV
jgi:hypothetical protein